MFWRQFRAGWADRDIDRGAGGVSSSARQSDTGKEHVARVRSSDWFASVCSDGTKNTTHLDCVNAIPADAPHLGPLGDQGQVVAVQEADKAQDPVRLIMKQIVIREPILQIQYLFTHCITLQRGFSPPVALPPPLRRGGSCAGPPPPWPPTDPPSCSRLPPPPCPPP